MFKRTDTVADLAGSFLAARAGSSVRDENPVSMDLGDQDEGNQQAGPSNSEVVPAAPVKKFFSGTRFRILGDADCEAVCSAIGEHGGQWVADEDRELVDFVIVRLVQWVSVQNLSGRWLNTNFSRFLFTRFEKDDFSNKTLKLM